jgi:hypothetical protein
VPRTQTFCENRSRLNDGREIGLKGSALNERFLSVGTTQRMNAREIIRFRMRPMHYTRKPDGGDRLEKCMDCGPKVQAANMPKILTKKFIENTSGSVELC